MLPEAEKGMNVETNYTPPPSPHSLHTPLLNPVMDKTLKLEMTFHSSGLTWYINLHLAPPPETERNRKKPFHVLCILAIVVLIAALPRHSYIVSRLFYVSRDTAAVSCVFLVCQAWFQVLKFLNWLYFRETQLWMGTSLVTELRSGHRT